MKCLVTRTVPWSDFFEILNKNLKWAPNEMVLWVQSGFGKQGFDFRKYRTVTVANGPFVFNALDEAILNKLKQEHFHTLIIPSNNPYFSGYDEFLKLGNALKIKSVLMITKDGQERLLSRTKIWKRLAFLKYKGTKSWLWPLTKEIFKTLITIPIALLLLPFAYVGYRLRAFFVR